MTCGEFPFRALTAFSHQHLLAGAAEPQRIKVVTYNVLADDRDAQLRVPHLLGLLQKQKADVVCLQEVAPWFVKRMQEQPLLKSFDYPKRNGTLFAPYGLFIHAIDRTSPKPLYRQVREILLQEITSGRIAAGDAILDERRLAEKLGLNRMTVRKALLQLAEEGVLERIRGCGTFVKQVPAGGSPPHAASDHLTLGIVAPLGQADLQQDVFSHRIFQGIYAGSQDLECSLVFRTAREPYDEVLESIRTDDMLDGVIVYWLIAPDMVRSLSESVPVVLLESAHPESGPGISRVEADCQDAVAQAMCSLLCRGHTDIAMMTLTRRTSVIAQREDVCRSTLEQHGIGVRIPQDISVVGFGDSGVFVSPPLSSIRLPLEQMGRAALEALVDLIRGPSQALIIKRLPCEWIERASCGPVATARAGA